MDPRLRHRQTKGTATVERLLTPPRHISTLQLRLRVRIVVRDVRSTVRLSHLQVDEQVGHRLGPHTTAAVGMQCECARLDVLLGYISAMSCSASSAGT